MGSKSLGDGDGSRRKREVRWGEKNRTFSVGKR